MYRKVAFLLVNIFRINVNIKSSFLLLFSFCSVYTMKIYSPFVSKELNVLELTSNFTTFIILFSGTLYIHNIGVYWQAFLFANIMIFNSLFCILCLLSLIKIFFFTNFQKIQRYFPRLSTIYISFLKTNKTFRRKSLNIIEFMKQYQANYRQERKELRKKANFVIINAN